MEFTTKGLYPLQAEEENSHMNLWLIKLPQKPLPVHLSLPLNKRRQPLTPCEPSTSHVSQINFGVWHYFFFLTFLYLIRANSGSIKIMSVTQVRLTRCRTLWSLGWVYT